MTHVAPTPIVYTIPTGCVQCRAVKNLLAADEVEYVELNLHDHPDKADEFRDQGYTVAPITIIGDQIVSGFQPDRIRELLKG